MMMSAANQNVSPKDNADERVISDFARGDPSGDVPGDWRGFSDRAFSNRAWSVTAA